jgi:HTH-type transcriptional regulator/antitoxin HigA
MTTTEADRYGELLRKTRPRVIRSEAENESALREIDMLMQRGDAISGEESELLALLVALVERFEEEHYALPTAAPVDVLRELMAARSMKQRDVAMLFGSKGIASEVLAGKRGISKSQAKRLAEFFGVSVALFI